MFFSYLFFYFCGLFSFGSKKLATLSTFFLIGVIVFYFIDIILFYIRRAAGYIQGAVLFDPKDKKIYVFPSIASNYYLEYHESELIYTIERYLVGRNKTDNAYVFFSNEDNYFAFKVKNLKDNNFDVMLSQQKPINMSIPFKHRFHSASLVMIGSVGAFLGLLILGYLMPYISSNSL